MSFPKYPAYKDSGVEWLGDVPKQWSITRFKSVFAERSDRSVTGEEELLSVSSYTGVTPRRSTLEEGEFLSRAESLEGYRKCSPGDLVMNIMLAWNRGLGVTQYEGIVSPAYSVFSVVDNSEPRFLHYLVRSDEYVSYFKAFSAGVIDSRLRLYPEVFSRLSVVLPSQHEQEVLASFLDHETSRIDALIAEQQRLIELLKEKRQAVISQAVTKGLDPSVPMKDSGDELLGSVPQHWTVSKLGHLTSKIGSGKTPRGGATAYVDEGIIFLRSQNVHDDGLRLDQVAYIDEATDTEMQGSKVLPLDVLMNITGASIGRSTIVPRGFPPANVNQHVSVIRLLQPMDLAEWVSVVLQSRYVQTRVRLSMTGAARDGLTGDELAQFRVPIPPHHERVGITTFVRALETKWQLLAKEAEHAVQLLVERRSALISAAVTGKIDVRNWQPPANDSGSESAGELVHG